VSVECALAATRAQLELLSFIFSEFVPFHPIPCWAPFRVSFAALCVQCRLSCSGSFSRKPERNESNRKRLCISTLLRRFPALPLVFLSLPHSPQRTSSTSQQTPRPLSHPLAHSRRPPTRVSHCSFNSSRPSSRRSRLSTTPPGTSKRLSDVHYLSSQHPHLCAPSSQSLHSLFR
jgi:hypothetical protein